MKKISVLLLLSCSGNKKEEIVIEEKDIEMQMIEAYREGLVELEKNDALYAARKFNEAELLYPQSVWAPRAALMAAYSYFSLFYHLFTVTY